MPSAILINPKYIYLMKPLVHSTCGYKHKYHLLIHLRETRQLSYIFITHDIQAATYLCDQLIIFKNGKIEERSNKRIA